MAPALYALDPSSRLDLCTCLFKNVQNVRELVTKARNGRIECALLNPRLLYDPFQIVVAANKAVLSLESGTLKTRNVHSEIIYNLSPSKNISKSLSTFGICEQEKVPTYVLVAVLYERDSKRFEQCLPEIKGEMIPSSDMKTINDILSIKKAYDIKDNSLLPKIITILATK